MTLLRQIEGGVDQGRVKAHLVRKALMDRDINTRGLGYALMAEAHLRAVLVEFKPKASDPAACFDYLLTCIHADLEWDEDYAHSREDALYELSGVLDPYWAEQGVGLNPVAFWTQASEVMRALDAEDVAVFLEGCTEDAAFDAAMQDWAKDPVLAEFRPS
jgi:hypothetical protein